AVANEDDRHVSEGLGGARIAVELSEMVGRFRHEALEPAGLPEFSGAGIGGVDRKLGCQQHRIHAGLRNLPRYQWPVAYVAFQRRAVAVEEHDDDARFADVEILRHMHPDTIVVEGFVLPVNPATVTPVAAT